MNIVVGCDANGRGLLDTLVRRLQELNYQVEDMGVPEGDGTAYPAVAERVACAVKDGKFTRAILICGTGIGMAIVANKIPGVRAACCHDAYSAERARKSNDTQVLTMGAQVIGPSSALAVLDIWLASEFAGGRSAPKVDLINTIDRRYHREGPDLTA